MLLSLDHIYISLIINQPQATEDIQIQIKVQNYYTLNKKLKSIMDTSHFAPWLFCPRSFRPTSLVVSPHFLGCFASRLSRFAPCRSHEEYFKTTFLSNKCPFFVIHLGQKDFHMGLNDLDVRRNDLRSGAKRPRMWGKTTWGETTMVRNDRLPYALLSWYCMSLGNEERPMNTAASQ